MLGSNRINHVAVGLGLLLALAVVVGLLISAYSRQTGYELSSANYAQAYADAGTRQLQACRLAASNRNSCAARARENAREGQRKERDLEAQRVTATWTAHMGAAAIIGVAVSIVGVGLVFTTFRESKRSADAADKTFNAFIAFEDANIAIECYKARHIGGSENHVSFLWKIRNLGRSPAQIHMVDFGNNHCAREVAIASGETQEIGHRVIIPVESMPAQIESRVHYSTAIRERSVRPFTVVAFNFTAPHAGTGIQQTMHDPIHRET